MEHVRVKAASDTSVFFQAIAGLAIALLVVLGVGGTVYNLLAPGGWLPGLFDRSLAGGLAAILALLIIGLCLRLMQNVLSIRGRNRHAGVFVYGFAAAGAVYAFQFLAKGGL